MDTFNQSITILVYNAFECCQKCILPVFTSFRIPVYENNSIYNLSTVTTFAVFTTPIFLWVIAIRKFQTCFKNCTNHITTDMKNIQN